MAVFVAYNESNHPVDVVLTSDKQKAHLYWQGKGITPISVREFNDQQLADHPTGLISILSTKVKDGFAMRQANLNGTYVMVNKG